MTPSQHLLEFNRDLQHRVAQLQQDNQQLQAELAQLRQEYEQLQQSQARYRQLFKNAPISMLFINTEGYVTEMNRAAEHLFGLSLEQMNQQACPIFANPQLGENGTLPYMLRALAGEAVIEEPTYYDTSRDFDGGKLHYAKGHYCPIRDKAGVVREIVEISPDFADLLAAQQTLQAERDRAATERLELVGTIAQVANLLLKSPDYTTVLFDVVRLLGEAARADRCSLLQNIIDSASGKSAVQLKTEWCRAGIQASIAHTPELESALLWEDFALDERLVQGETVQFFGTDLCASLRELFAAQGNTAMLMVPIVVQEEFWGVFRFDYCSEVRRFEELDQSIFAIAVDSIAAAIERQQQDEALRKSEYRYRTLFELSNEGIYRFEFEPPISISLSTSEQIEQVHRSYRIAEVNSTCVAQYGLTNRDELIGSGLVDTHVPDLQVNYEHARIIIENGYSGRHVETEEIDSQGQRKYFLQNVVCDVRDGYIWGGWGTQTDITELKQAQQALLQAEQAILLEREQAAQARAAELAKANDVLKNTLDTLATEPELDCFLRHILSVISQQMDALACLLWLFDDSLQTATLHLSYTDAQVNVTAQPRFHADSSYPLCLHSPNWIFRLDQRQPYLVEVANPAFSRASCAYLTRLGIKTILIVPLWLGDRLSGSFGVHLPAVRDLAPSQLELVQALAHQAKLALQLMQLTEQASHSAVLEERNRMAREIHDVLAQAFTGVVVNLEAAKMITPQYATLQPLLTQAQDSARAGLVEARRSVWSLRPQALENTNLRSALAQLVKMAQNLTWSGMSLPSPMKADKPPIIFRSNAISQSASGQRHNCGRMHFTMR